MAKKSPPSAIIRAQLLEKTRDFAVEAGWNASALNRAATALNLSAGELRLAAPDGIDTLLLAWADESDDQTRAIMHQADLATMKIREKVTFGVRTRIEALGPHRKSAGRAAHALAAPWRAPLGAKILWNAADTIWAALGDTSTDSNWYTKRMTLSGVLASTLNVWLSEEDEQLAWKRLDDRIENVMQFEKLKVDARKFTDKLPDPLDLLKLVPRRPF